MAKGFKHGGGGGSASSALNFKIVGGTAQPSGAAENTIWVNTEEITSWVFSPVQPASPDPGTVWIATGDASAAVFNALKKNGIMIYPLAAKQYINGRWTACSASIRQGDAWNQFSTNWDGYLFKDGDQYEDITGGWSSDGWPVGTSSTMEVGNVLLVSSPGAWSAAYSGTNKAVDLTDINKIRFDSPNGQNGNYYPGYLMISRDKTEATNAGQVAISAAGEGELDVSGLSGFYYIALRALGGANGSAYANVRAIWTE